MLENHTNKIVSKLLLSSTASILHNLGFSTAKSSSLATLNSLLGKFLQITARDMKERAEIAKGPGTDPTMDELVAVLEQMGFNLNELDDYMHFVAPFPPESAVPMLPVQLCEIENMEDRNIAEATMDITMLKTPRQRLADARNSFPDFSANSSRDLHMCHLIDKNRYATSSSAHDNTMDSLATPILEFRRATLRKRPHAQKIVAKQIREREAEKRQPERACKKQQEKAEGNSGEGDKFKSVLSNQGLKLRLLNTNSDTPPGFFSRRTRAKKAVLRKK